MPARTRCLGTDFDLTSEAASSVLLAARIGRLVCPIGSRAVRDKRPAVIAALVAAVAVTVPIPVPVAYYSFGGWKESAFADHNQHGMDGVRFWTRRPPGRFSATVAGHFLPLSHARSWLTMTVTTAPMRTPPTTRVLMPMKVSPSPSA